VCLPPAKGKKPRPVCRRNWGGSGPTVQYSNARKREEEAEAACNHTVGLALQERKRRKKEKRPHPFLSDGQKYGQTLIPKNRKREKTPDSYRSGLPGKGKKGGGHD